MTIQQKLKHCVGCRDNFYNGRAEGNCWALPSMKLLWRKEVPIWQVPPWDQPAIQKPNCYHRKGYAYVGKDQTN